MDTTTIWVIIAVAAATLVVGFFVARGVSRRRREKEPPTLEFKILQRQRGTAGPPPSRRAPGRTSGGLDDLIITKNPTARCLLTGKVARECRCDKHRSVQ